MVLSVVIFLPFAAHFDKHLFSAFNTTFGRKPGFKDLGGGLKEAVRIVTAKKHPSGAVILMVKTGTEPNTGNVTIHIF